MPSRDRCCRRSERVERFTPVSPSLLSPFLQSVLPLHITPTTTLTFSPPQASVSLIFLPFVPIPILTAFWSMVALDFIGILRGWRMFDHVAHIVGAFVGVLYFEYGADIFDDLRAALGSGKEKPAS